MARRKPGMSQNKGYLPMTVESLLQPQELTLTALIITLLNGEPTALETPSPAKLHSLTCFVRTAISDWSSVRIPFWLIKVQPLLLMVWIQTATQPDVRVQELIISSWFLPEQMERCIL